MSRPRQQVLSLGGQVAKEMVFQGEEHGSTTGGASDLGVDVLSFTAVSCPRAVRCIAVGGYFSPSGKAFALAERWDGTAWRRLDSIRSPDLAFNYLYAVSCPATARCVAAGEQGIQLASAYQWDGATWRSLRPRNP